jgi:hypothetical protein
MLHPHDQVRIGDERQILQRFLQVTRTYLAGSPRPVDRPGQAHLHFLVHVRSPFRFSAHCRVGRMMVINNDYFDYGMKALFPE